MIIILSAFGKMQGKPVNVPENIGLRWKMALVQPATNIMRTGEHGMMPSFPTVCEFEYSGGNIHLPNGDFAREYVLIDISKQ